jgi:hypothetical protein
MKNKERIRAFPLYPRLFFQNLMFWRALYLQNRPGTGIFSGLYGYWGIPG